MGFGSDWWVNAQEARQTMDNGVVMRSDALKMAAIAAAFGFRLCISPKSSASFSRESAGFRRAGQETGFWPWLPLRIALHHQPGLSTHLVLCGNLSLLLTVRLFQRLQELVLVQCDILIGHGFAFGFVYVYVGCKSSVLVARKLPAGVRRTAVVVANCQ